MTCDCEIPAYAVLIPLTGMCMHAVQLTRSGHLGVGPNVRLFICLFYLRGGKRTELQAPLQRTLWAIEAARIHPLHFHCLLGC
jgi:hypothetical protein